MNNSVLLDTNVFIYALDADSKFHEQSKLFLQNPDYQLSTTSKNISEFLVVLTRTESVKIQITHAMDILL